MVKRESPKGAEEWATQVPELLTKHSICQCAAEDMPCLKHNRLVFEVYWFAKYGLGPFASTLYFATAHPWCWFPLDIEEQGVMLAEETALQERLGLPAVVDRSNRLWRLSRPAVEYREAAAVDEDLETAVLDYAALVRPQRTPA